ncbi:hypothetical protein AVEN_157568-1 [Araneus ventricosus]|uniref:Uncharacterized protein n=1 Tax=Araneus ventricosus TaxID=182803 RepID=A0A4Y2HJA9_ARAVE|nr:hypothetical protein AVEN_157568-1 [Araneus ventricosus]
MCYFFRVYIQRKIDEIRKEKHKLEKETNGRKVRKSWNVTNAEDVKDWRTVRKWRKIAENQMPLSAVRQDYSRIIIQNLCEKFYDEAKEATNPQVLDVKSIYKFMLECVSGQIPSQLPIKESTYVLVLLRFMKDMFQKYDFQEEHQFIHNFRKPVEFVPARVKDEFRKNLSYDPGTVPIPIDLFENLMCHRQVVNSFNPLGIPLWLLTKEQNDTTVIGPYAPFGFKSIKKQLWRNKQNVRPISDSEIKAVLSQMFKTDQWLPPAGHVSEDMTSHA